MTKLPLLALLRFQNAVTFNENVSPGRQSVAMRPP
jgi:hypothetical protein